MKAIAQNAFGDAGVLSLQELPDPLVGPDQVLVAVKAASVNPVDYKIREGYIQGALPHHFPLIQGWDAAGVVVKAGPAADGYQPGDEVLGYLRKDHVQNGTYAELVAAPERGLAHKPAGITFEQAAALPLAGLTALQLLKKIGVGEGDTVLVHAAAGGVGHLAVQIAHVLGATKVLGTASERNHDFLRSLGAEPVTYGEGLEDRVAALLGGDGKVDAVVDLIGGEALSVSPKLVRDPTRIGSIIEDRVRETGGKYVFVKPNSEQLGWLANLTASGDITVVIEKVFPLAEAADAQRLVEGGHVRGKVVISVP
ncbi:NADP-dependent oxidoreductase [Kutzneria buriramensis]|uniref:NADPH:quinone reductase-like Zn-dependent oxidoreductase n=1 Tax=Kutzneria buriramensis TaxID=1045776 RepID=A0A3E0GZS5_9PSEU|nr:NADP-dependent oxidoreductase [Kutzneria buriramensis]REH35844.1 NADPH:quinone reductase-like Zn-dependent oxidoreductase [Kutzneria buriramensis]